MTHRLKKGSQNPDWPGETRETDYCDHTYINCTECSRPYQISEDAKDYVCEFCQLHKKETAEQIDLTCQKIEEAILQHKATVKDLRAEGFSSSQILPMPLVSCCVCGAQVDAEVYLYAYKCKACPECDVQKGKVINVEV